MGLLKIEIVLLLIFAAASGFCKGSVYKVGDSVGWTIIGNVDYGHWASSKTFQVGDTLVFEYDQEFHNVMQVSRSDFHSCNTAAPLATYATGNDSIAMHSQGHYYYICGVVGHCQAGQKVEISVLNSPLPTVSGPVHAPQDLPIMPVGQSPSPSSAELNLLKNGLFSTVAGFPLLLIWALI